MSIIAVVLFSFLSAWAWNEVFLRFARRLGALNQGIPNQRRWDSRKKPIIGGIAFFVVALGIGAWKPADLQLSRALLAGAAIAFLTGLADDAYVSVPYVKLLGQLSAAGASIIFGGPLLTISPMPALSVLFTLFWYVAVMNALNMMDNMDGIAGSLTLIFLLSSFWLLPQSPHLLLYLGLAGAVGAFLLRNFYPSHLYMGDNGSQFLGFVLAYWGTELWHAPIAHTADNWVKVLMLVSLYSLLAGDTFWVSIMRLIVRRNPFSGGTDHLTHRLAQFGLSPRYIVVLLAAVQGLLVLGTGLLLRSQPAEWGFVGVIGLVGIAIGAVHLSYLLPIIHRTKSFSPPISFSLRGSEGERV
ncbi:MAG: undecaprenyl/decaprenyl-phosphate alpha-N-acetylglucosaminyl 1-phosphate transferase [Bacteroidia bacterium]|nr:undecaprenyl/decaprenyl-phosphate alpha-N-acetylglucosaminyl 1-phosphate transferase [Bacteroidia bacterium]